MMVSLFILLTISTIFAWSGWQRTAITLFIITLVLAVLLFAHHLTAHLNLNL